MLEFVWNEINNIDNISLIIGIISILIGLFSVISIIKEHRKNWDPNGYGWGRRRLYVKFFNWLYGYRR